MAAARKAPPSLMCSVAEAARILGVSEQTIRNRIAADTFPVTVRRVGTRTLINRDQLEAWCRGEDRAAS